MFAFEDLQKLQQNPQLLEQLINSPIDPNAVLKYQMGGPSPELAGVHMGTQNQGVPQPTATPIAPTPTPDAWSALGKMGTGMTGQAPRTPPPSAGAPVVGGAPKAPRPPVMGATIRPTRQQSLDEMLASFRK